jgi:hypothetical protein
MNKQLKSALLRKPTLPLFGTLLILSLFNTVYGQDRDAKRPESKDSLLGPREVHFQSQSLWDVFYKLTETLNINIVFHANVQPLLRKSDVNLKLENVSYPKAINLFLDKYELDYVEVDERTIMVVKRPSAAAVSKPLEDFVINANKPESREQSTYANSKFPSTSAVFNSTSLLAMIEQLARIGHLAVEFDPQFAETHRITKVDYFVLRNTTYPRALQVLLTSYDLNYSIIDRNTIKIGVDIANPSHVPLEEIMTWKEK